MGVQIPPRVPKDFFWNENVSYIESNFVMADLMRCDAGAHIAQSVEHYLGKVEVSGSSPVVGSIFLRKKMVK